MPSVEKRIETAASREAGSRKLLKKRIVFVAAYVVIAIAFHILAGGKFLTIDNLNVVLAHAVFTSFIAWAIGFIFTAGIMELSIGSNVLLSANVGALLAVQFGLGYVGMFAGTIICSAILEVLSVSCCVKLKLPSWISALGMALIYEAILTEYSTQRAVKTGQTLINLGQQFRFFGRFPGNAILLVIGLIGAYMLYIKSDIGVNIRAIGDSPNVAAAMGIRRDKTLLIGALVGGVFIGIGATAELSYAAYMPGGSGLTSISYIFKALAAFLLADSFSDILPYPVGVLFSTFLISGVFNVLTHLGVPSGTGQDICLGAAVVLCGIASKLNYKGVTK